MTSDDYRPCVVLNRSGELRRANIRCVRLQDQAQALQKLREDKAAWVRPEDADTVLAAYRAEVTHAASLPAWAAEFGPAPVPP